MPWGVHIHRCKRKHSPSLKCTKCQSPLTNTHILGGCRFTAKLRTKCHNSTFRLLLRHLHKSNGGRWPILCDARTTGSDHTIHVYSTAPYRARRVSLEVAWGVHIHRCKRKHSPSLICNKCQSPLTNTHILGGCRFTAKLRIKRHNSTFRLLLQQLHKSNGGAMAHPMCIPGT